MNSSVDFSKGICLYKKIKLSRNLEKHPFTAAMTTDQSEAIKEQIENCLPFMDTIRHFELTDIALESRQSQQRYLGLGILSVDPFRSNLTVGLKRSKNGQFYLTINDLDHIRVSLMSYEESFDELWQSMDLIDDNMSQFIEVAYMEPFGYLTSRIEQLGTGFNGEALLHLPALKKTGFIQALSESLGSIGVHIKPFKSDFYMVFNTVTLGRSEIELALLLDQVVDKLSERERAGRETLWASEGMKIKDQIGRTYGQCQYATIVEEEEGIQWISNLMLGESYGILLPKHTHNESISLWDYYLKQMSDLGSQTEGEHNLNMRERMHKRGERLNSIQKNWNWRG